MYEPGARGPSKVGRAAGPSRLRPKVPGLLKLLRAGRWSLTSPLGLYSRGLYSRGVRRWTDRATSPDAAMPPTGLCNSAGTSDGLAAAASRAPSPPPTVCRSHAFCRIPQRLYGTVGAHDPVLTQNLRSA